MAQLPHTLEEAVAGVELIPVKQQAQVELEVAVQVVLILQELTGLLILVVEEVVYQMVALILQAQVARGLLSFVTQPHTLMPQV
jgi:hypothetical protein